MKEKITREEVRHVADLARLELSEQEESRMTEQMNQILGYMDQLNELNTEGVSPTTHAIELRNVFREDEVRESLPREQALANAPQSDGVNFLVPKVI
ncbi:MAG TPA: Asp-tRNA(Asn)/Glu-tRNA(Gln) amidotransferase subunit GatC [Syntrophobacteraceae bacterium]|nr:Asp-tRNA(Asn)/Glu-tRNA(Gln) amidotransferase subunit GatC [Syntrophobacteraceae bacterium]